MKIVLAFAADNEGDGVHDEVVFVGVFINDDCV